MIKKQLVQLGFTKNEVRIYLSLFELGKARAGALIEETGLHRNIVYTALEALVGRELVTKTNVGGVAEFVANSPDKLVSEIDEKRLIAEHIAEELKQKQNTAPREITVYEGFEGVKKCRRSVLEYPPSEEMFIFASRGSSTPEMEKVWKAFHKKREAYGMGAKFLYEAAVNKRDLDWRNNLPRSEARYLPFGMEFPIWFSGVADHLEIGVPSDNPLTFRIKSEEAVQAFRKFFDYFWDQDVHVETGDKALHNIFYNMLDELGPGEEYYVIGATSGELSQETLDFYKQFHTKRVKKGVVASLLVSHEYAEHYGSWIEEHGKEWKQVSHWKKFISENPQPFQINLFKGKTRIVIYGDEPTVIYINRPEVYQGFKLYFDTLWDQNTKTFQGEGAKEKAFQDILDTLEPGQEVLVMGMFDFDQEFADFVVDFHTRRAEEGKFGRILINAHAKELERRFQQVDKTEIRSMPQGVVTPGVFLVYGNKALITLPNQRTFIQIENKEAADAFRVYFEQQWKQDTRVAHGAEAVKQIWLESLAPGKLDFVGARGYFVDRNPDMFEEILAKAKEMKELSWRNVVDSSAKTHKLNKLPWMEARFTIKGSKNPNVIWLWGEKVAVANWTEDEPVVFISENKHLVQSYRDYFYELWEE